MCFCSVFLGIFFIISFHHFYFICFDIASLTKKNTNFHLLDHFVRQFQHRPSALGNIIRKSALRNTLTLLVSQNTIHIRFVMRKIVQVESGKKWGQQSRDWKKNSRIE